MQIALEQVSKDYKACKALAAISLVVEEGELIAIIGPSGSGKSTLLKIIAGLENPTQGQIYIDHKNVTKLSPKDRGIGFVFQHYALFKHMTVFENIAFGHRVKERKKRLSNQEIINRVNELSKLVQIENLHDRYPHELSGGQRQRVALARALAVEPKILLLDEPFAALDAKLKLELRRWLRKLQKETKITIILVTHDQEEALDVADRIMVLNSGRIEQIDSPEKIYHEPDNSFVYNFLGHYNVFKAVKDVNGKVSILDKQESSMIKKEKWYSKHKIVSSIANMFTVHKKNEHEKMEEYLEIFVRPHDIEISRKSTGGDDIEAYITHINLAAPLVKLELESPKYELVQAEITHEVFNNLQISKGDVVYLKPKQFTMFE